MEEVDGIDWIPWRFLGVGKRKWEVCNIAKADTYVISRHLEAFGDSSFPSDTSFSSDVNLELVTLH